MVEGSFFLGASPVRMPTAVGRGSGFCGLRLRSSLAHLLTQMGKTAYGALRIPCAANAQTEDINRCSEREQWCYRARNRNSQYWQAACWRASMMKRLRHARAVLILMPQISAQRSSVGTRAMAQIKVGHSDGKDMP